MKFVAFILCCVFATSAWAQDPPKAEPPPESLPNWVTRVTPYDSESQGARIDVPPGYRLCWDGNVYSSYKGYYVLLDTTLRCEDIDARLNWESLPDFIVIYHSRDTPMTMDALDDFVGSDRFFCHGKASSLSKLRESSAPTSIKRVGKILAGHDTATCTREDIKNDRYSKQFMAFRPWHDMEEVDDLYTISAYVHMKNKDAANRVLDQIVKSYKLLK